MSIDQATGAAGTRPLPGTGRMAPAMVRRPGRWIENWDPENDAVWQAGGKILARRNLAWSIACEFLGFVTWQLFSIVAVYLPAAGFTYSTSQIFWLISMPSLVGATLRIPYTFMVPRFGGRNWTVISALLLLIPAVGMAVCVSDPRTPFGVMLLCAAAGGFGGGNFASSMANISFFYPAREKGWALGLNAAGGNLGAAVAQLVVPIAVTAGAAAAPGLPLASLVWVPLILLAAAGAFTRMDNLAGAKGDVAGSLAALKEPHLWLLALLYIGTFGSFIGFSGVFPKLIRDVFPDFSTFAVGTAALSLSFLGPLVGSLSRPCGGRLADRFGGARITVASFAVMALAALAVMGTLPLKNFWLFLGLFLVLFAASGIGNGSTYRMIPAIFALRSRTSKTSGTAGTCGHDVGSQRKASAALGLVSAIGAYGGFVIPQVLNASNTATGGYGNAFCGFVGAYVIIGVLTWYCYLRPASHAARANA